MSASSPVPNNNKVADPFVAITAAINGNSPGTTPQRLDNSSKNQRGLNKPKCIKCGNVARSRCPFQSCKNCCAKAQNPCHIHVLKQTSILPDKPPPSTTPLSEQPSPEVPSTGASWRLSSLKQLSTTFANSLRARKPLTRKDVINTNKWRFSKLREHIEGNIEAENEAFDRYMWNVNLLEETYSTEGFIPDDQSEAEYTSSEEFQKLVSTIKVKLRSHAKKADSCRERIRDLVNQKLRKLQERVIISDEGSPCTDELIPRGQVKRQKTEREWRAEKTTIVNDLVDKLSKARNEDDLKSCMEMKLQLVNPIEKRFDNLKVDSNVDATGSLVPKEKEESAIDLPSYCMPKVCTVVHIDQEDLYRINAELLTSNQLAEL